MAGAGIPLGDRHDGAFTALLTAEQELLADLPASAQQDLADLLHEVLVAQVATYLGVEPSVIDPSLGDE